MYPIITTVLMTFGAGFAGASFAKAQGPGQALDDIMALVGFDKLREIAEKKRAIREQNIIEFKESIAQEIVKIREDDIQEPHLSVVGPALEASKYYIEEDVLRNMFAKLIASAMDSSKNALTHPAFVEVIKQLSPFDALFIRNMSNLFPLKQIVIKGAEPEKTPIMGLHKFYNGPVVTGFVNFYYGNGFEDYVANAKSISNLLRLGLIDIIQAPISDDDSEYDGINNGFELFKSKEENIELLRKANDDLPKEHAPYIFETHQNYIRLTHFGESFFETCI
ncbi:DUF4393 domain-containing protein [Listeria booriae]|uniref:DUF4393 domain-containing protein n=1 Tax=Listeria booriae TaxID=1552123 RepID=UPI00162799D5|nr:DUF4393 domain-containing protein [Listeria booriae]MBC1893130.1 DUF4393 domain-containing protein [Listeria booriae]MBC1974534.1 DUF4393 domain-containing protein [Listeria booriae]MBC2031826.1 DUF4393 domain-containing protein [Listeria booriae]